MPKENEKDCIRYTLYIHINIIPIPLILIKGYS